MLNISLFLMSWFINRLPINHVNVNTLLDWYYWLTNDSLLLNMRRWKIILCIQKKRLISPERCLCMIKLSYYLPTKFSHLEQYCIFFFLRCNWLLLLSLQWLIDRIEQKEPELISSTEGNKTDWWLGLNFFGLVRVLHLYRLTVRIVTLTQLARKQFIYYSVLIVLCRKFDNISLLRQGMFSRLVH